MCLYKEGANHQGEIPNKKPYIGIKWLVEKSIGRQPNSDAGQATVGTKKFPT
jgi:hypothetical protein